MLNQSQFYEESGKVNSLGFLVVVLLLIALIIPLSFVYNLLAQNIPLIYLTFLCTGAYAFLIGNGIRQMTRRSHNRNFKSRIGLAIFAGLFAIFCAWVAYVLWALGMEESASFGTYFSNLTWPMTDSEGFFAIINEIGKNGMWSIGSGDTPVSGGFLYAVWAVEFLMLLAIPVLLVWTSDTFPYSESLGKKYEKYTLQQAFGTVVGSQRFFDELTANVPKAVTDIGVGEAWRHTIIHVYYLTDDPHAYLDFESVSIEDRGKGKTETSLIIENFKIDKGDAKVLMEEYNAKLSRF